MSDLLIDLENDYCPPIDPATFKAIVSDFDLNDDEQYKEATSILGQIKASAEAEASSGFDPSASSYANDLAGLDLSGSSPSDLKSSDTGLTDMTSAFSAFQLDTGDTGYDRGIDDMPSNDKSGILKRIFPEIKPMDVEFALKKQRGDFGAAVEVLLNQQYLANEVDEDGNKHHVPKGVDGFAANEYSGSARKGKGKGKGKGKKGKKEVGKLSLSEQLVEGSASSVNSWQKGQDDVRFITERVNIPDAFVKSAYNKAGRSLRDALFLICEQDPKEKFDCTTDISDPFVQSNAIDLHTEYPSVEVLYATRLALLTHPFMASARELAEIMVRPHQETLLPKYADAKFNTHVDTAAALEAEELQYYSEISSLPVRTAFDTLRSNAFAQASAAYRKSRSNPLMGGAAAYYASVGHTANAAMKQNRAIEANQRVADQSSEDMCDLHGTTVAEATRIAKQYVERWWTKHRELVQRGDASRSDRFRVVVGRGSHSATGAKLGPAVSKMLKAEGWKVDEGQVGELVVRGKARK